MNDPTSKSKTKEQRLVEVLNVRRKLHTLGYRDAHSSVKELFDVLTKYVDDGEYFEGKFKIHGHGKTLNAILFSKKPILVEIKHTEGV